MDARIEAIIGFLRTVHPFDGLPPDEMARVAASLSCRDHPAGSRIYAAGEPLPGLFLIRRGAVEITDAAGLPVSRLGPGTSFGERGLLREGRAVTSARAGEDSEILILPAAEFRRLLAAHPAFERVFHRGRAEARGGDLATQKVADLMAPSPVTCAPDTPAVEAARAMRAAGVSSLGVVEGDGRLVGIVTTRDLVHRLLAEGRDPALPVRAVMTPDPVTLPPEALGSDVLHLMLERRIGHIPVVAGERLVGMVTQTDLTRFQAVSAAQLVRDAAGAGSVEALAAVTARIPALLVQLVAAHSAHEVVTRLVTDVADAVTRRLLALAEAELGPPPVPYAWLACGSQGRQEQTGITDQDNCLFIDDRATAHDMAWFAALARFVCDGLHAAGYVHCPGGMMAMTPRWCQPVRVWRDYFRGWVERPDPMAQMLASVMFDLRPVGGTVALFRDLQAETLAMASKNTIFVAHMIANALKHAPPLGLLGGFSTIRSGEHRNAIDMKLTGVVPVVDLARIYALQGRIEAVNTRARLAAAAAAGVVSEAGGRDLTDAYDLIAALRLEHQAARIRAGQRPDNFLQPAALSDFERSQLRDAFAVVRTMQAALGHGRGAPG